MKQIQKIIQYTVILFASTLVFSSCEKTGDQPDNALKKVKQIDYDGGSYEAVDYNSDGTVSKITNHTVNTGGQAPDHIISTFTYVNGLVSEISSDNGVKLKFTYDGKNVVKTEIFSLGGNQIAYYQYTYTSGKVTQVDGFLRVPGAQFPTVPTMRYVNEYYANGNLKKTSVLAPDGANMKKVNEIVIDEYDTKFNTTALFENNPFLPLENFLPNNPLKETHFDLGGNISETVTHTYTYDAAGNPLTRKSVSKGVGAAEYTENATITYW